MEANGTNGTRKFTREQILDKVQKALALANDPAADPNVAAVATARAQVLMQQWAIEENELAGKRHEEVKHGHEVIPWQTAKPLVWEGWLAMAVGKPFFAHPVKDERKGMYFFGRLDDAQTAAYVYSQLRFTLDAMSREGFKRHASEYKARYGQSVYAKSNAQAYRSRWITSWMDGAIAAIRHKLEQQHEQFAASSSTALVVVETREQEAFDAAIGFFKGLRAGRPTRRTIFTEARDRGREAGANVDIHAGLTDKRDQRLLK